MDVAGQVSCHRLVGVHQAVPLEVIRQVDHPGGKDRNLTFNKITVKRREEDGCTCRGGCSWPASWRELGEMDKRRLSPRARRSWERII